MADRENTTSYEHPQETNLLNLHKAMEYNDAGEPIVRVSVGGESITITGDVTIPGSVEINNDTGNPIPCQLDATSLAALESVDLNPATLAALETTTVLQGTDPWIVDGEVALDSATLSALENISIDNFPATQTVDGTVNIGTMPDVTVNQPIAITDNDGSLTVDGTVALDTATLTALENITVDSITANVTVEGEVTLGATTLAALETTTVLQGTDPWTVDGTVELGSTTLAALENVTVDSITANVTVEGEVTVAGNVTVEGEVALDSTTLAALETITVDTVTGNVTVEGAVSVDNFPATQTVDGTVIIQDGGGSITVDGTVDSNVTGTVSVDNFPTTQTVDGTVNIGTMPNVTVNQPIAVTDNDSSLTVDGTVSVDNFPTTQTVDGTVGIIGNVTVDGEVEVAGNVTVEGEVTVGEITGNVTINPLDFILDLSAGDVSGMGYIEKFGRNTTMSANIETIWDGGDIYTYLTTASSVYVTSSDNDDTTTGTGARTVEIQGLDENYALTTETVDVDDTASTTTFIRVFRVRTQSTGSSGQAEGEISVRSAAGGGGTLLAQILRVGTGQGASLGQTFMALYTVPAGKTAYITQWIVGAGAQNADTTALLVAREFNDGGYNAKDIIISAGQQFAKNYKVPLQFTEKTDIEVRGFTSTSGNDCSSTFNLILVDNA